MLRRHMTVVCALVLFIVGCGPRIERVSPIGRQRLDTVRVEGSRLTGALIEVDGGAVGSELLTAIGDPGKERRIVMPMFRPDGTFTGPTATVRASDPIGSDVAVYAGITMPISPPPVHINSVSPTATPTILGTEVWVIANGANIFPGAVNVLPDTPFAGPVDVRADDAAGLQATRTVYLGPGTLQVFFDNALLPSGPHRLYIKNDARYGAADGVSPPSVTFQK